MKEGADSRGQQRLGRSDSATRKFPLSGANMKWISPALAQEFARAGTDAYRVADGQRCRIERFGDGAIASYGSATAPLEIEDELARWCERAGVSLRRTYARRLVTAPGRHDRPEALGNAAPPHRGIAHEEGLAYEIDFMAGYSCGLFIDQRANRRRVRTGCSGRLLNLFSYTCSFSVAAAAAGAQTVNIDLAKSALDRGRRNFALNKLSTKGHRFVADDVLEVLPRLARRGERFEWIVLDPPTFSRGYKGRILRLESDYGRLIEMASECAAPGAMILLSANCSTFDTGKLKALGRGRLGYNPTFLEPEPLPDIPARQGASTIWMQIPG
jgi:23S rRNA (cytosine1962-C5)-methyltransferase